MIPLILGGLSGILGGMGIGGGAILIPSLVLLLGVSQHTAQAVNLCYFIPTAIFALIYHVKKKSVRFHDAGWMIVSGIPTAILASSFSADMEENVLRKLFAAFIFTVAIFEFFRKEKNPKS